MLVLLLNYVQIPLLDKNGDVILDKQGNPIMKAEKDGTLTYYDLWTGNSGGVGKHNAGEDVKDYYNIKNTTLFEIMTTDITESEGYAPNGVISIATDYKTDMKTHQAMTDFMSSSAIYNGISRNCSDMAKVGVESSVGKKIGAQEIMLNFRKSTTPNALYNATSKERSLYGPSIILKSPGNRVSKGFERAFKGW